MKKLSKTLTIVALLIGLVCLIITAFMWAEGSEGINASPALQALTLEPLFAITYILLAIAMLAVVFFSVYNWATNPKSFAKILPALGAFVLVLGISYFMADATPVVLSGGKISTEVQASVTDFCLYVAYIVGGLSVISVIAGGVIKMTR